MTTFSHFDPETDQPLYLELADALESAVFSGTLRPGEKLPTHRDLADHLGINVSTVTRGYREAEKRGLVSGTVGRGTFVTTSALTNYAMESPEPYAPGMINMGMITPMTFLEADAADSLKQLAARFDPRVFFQYTAPQGLAEHRKVGAGWVGRYGLMAGPESITVCAGSQHAICCCLAGLFQAGDRIATENLTYPGFKSVAAMLGMRLTGVDMDDEGMLPESLDIVCRRDDVKGVYVMPGMHNPTGAIMSEERKDALAEVALRHGLVILEDNAFNLTGPGRPLLERAPNQGVFIAGVSKAMAAGLRVSFLSAPERFRQPLFHAVLNTIWMVPPLCAELVCMWIRDGRAEEVIARKRAALDQRRELVEEVLAGCDYVYKAGGYYLWLSLPDRWSGNAFEGAARKRGVSLYAAERFAVGEAPAPKAVRVALTGTETTEELCKGLEVIRELMDLG